MDLQLVRIWRHSVSNDLIVKGSCQYQTHHSSINTHWYIHSSVIKTQKLMSNVQISQYVTMSQYVPICSMSQYVPLCHTMSTMSKYVPLCFTMSHYVPCPTKSQYVICSMSYVHIINSQFFSCNSNLTTSVVRPYMRLSVCLSVRLIP